MIRPRGRPNRATSLAWGPARSLYDRWAVKAPPILCSVLVALLCGCTGTIDGGGGGNGGGGGGGGGGAEPDAGGGGGGGTLYEQLSAPEQALFDILNEERVARDLEPLVLRASLVCAARRHSDDVGPVRSCSHTGTDGTSPTERVNDCGGGGWTGEVIACGQSTARAAVDAWLGSTAGHREAILGESKREIGVAMTDNYWTGVLY
jgi:hypothetical protein